jgi:Uma2 family endonuclease
MNRAAIVETESISPLSDYEIKRGKPMPDKNHSIIQSRLNYALTRDNGSDYSILTEINVDFPVRERVPDLAIYPILNFNPDENELRMEEVPLGAIEILSEAQSPRELLKKRSEYFFGGVKSYWFVLPALRTVYVYSAPDTYELFTHRDILKDPILNIELDLKEIFR